MNRVKHYLVSIVFAITLNASIALCGTDVPILDAQELTHVGTKPAGHFQGGAYTDAQGNKWLVKDFGDEDKYVTQADIQRFIINDIVAPRVLNFAFHGEYPQTALIKERKNMIAIQWLPGFISHEADIDKQCEINRASNAQMIMVRTLINWENNSESNVGCIERDGTHIPTRVDYDDSFWPSWVSSFEERCFAALENNDKTELIALTEAILGDQPTNREERLNQYEQVIDNALADIAAPLGLSPQEIKQHKRRIMYVLYEGLARVQWLYGWLTKNYSLLDYGHECHTYWQKRLPIES